MPYPWVLRASGGAVCVPAVLRGFLRWFVRGLAVLGRSCGACALSLREATED